MNWCAGNSSSISQALLVEWTAVLLTWETTNIAISFSVSTLSNKHMNTPTRNRLKPFSTECFSGFLLLSSSFSLYKYCYWTHIGWLVENESKTSWKNLEKAAVIFSICVFVVNKLKQVKSQVLYVLDHTFFFTNQHWLQQLHRHLSDLTSWI